MLTTQVKKHLESIIEERILDVKPMSGGDISNVFQFTTDKNRYVLKTNSSLNALNLFEAEKRGLETIAQTQTIKTPKVIYCGLLNREAHLIMEYVQSKSPSNEDMRQFGRQLANLHQNEASTFGNKQDNFIGSLPQSNTFTKSWIDFYINERLKPQFKLALTSGLLKPAEIPEDTLLYQTCDHLFQQIKPALLHGDLWNGNFLISELGEPVLIDPAVYYGHHEVDLAMSQLFGGFDDAFYKSYHEVIPKSNNFNARIDMYQLYYLLVHLNLFGASYHASVNRILRLYF